MVRQRAGRDGQSSLRRRPFAAHVPPASAFRDPLADCARIAGHIDAAIGQTAIQFASDHLAPAVRSALRRRRQSLPDCPPSVTFRPALRAPSPAPAVISSRPPPDTDNNLLARRHPARGESGSPVPRWSLTMELTARRRDGRFQSAGRRHFNKSTSARRRKGRKKRLPVYSTDR